MDHYGWPVGSYKKYTNCYYILQCGILAWGGASIHVLEALAITHRKL